MSDVDDALSQLGMLSSVSGYKLEYLKAVEKRAEERRAQSLNNSEEEVCIRRNGNFVADISICPRPRLPGIRTSLRLEREAKEYRFSDQFLHQCGKRKSCPSSHMCAFVSPPRSRAHVLSAVHSHPSLRLPGVLTSFRQRSSKSRSRVRFSHEPSENGICSTEELTGRLSGIKLNISSSPLSTEEVLVASVHGLHTARTTQQGVGPGPWVWNRGPVTDAVRDPGAAHSAAVAEPPSPRPKFLAANFSRELCQSVSRLALEENSGVGTGWGRWLLSAQRCPLPSAICVITYVQQSVQILHYLFNIFIFSHIIPRCPNLSLH